jgi:hypothetical protein
MLWGGGLARRWAEGCGLGCGWPHSWPPAPGHPLAARRLPVHGTTKRRRPLSVIRLGDRAGTAMPGAAAAAFSPPVRAAAGTRPTGSRAPGSTRLSARGRAHAQPAPGRSRTASMTRSPGPAPMGAPSRIPVDNTTKPVDTHPSGD